MIASQDRSGYFGASDTDKIIGNWNTATFERWWMQKIGINRDHFQNRYTAAGTHYEHRILESLGIPMELDKQIILEDLRLRVNLDGNTDVYIYECKTYKLESGFQMPRKYVNQVNVQMFASGIHNAKLVIYGLTEADYDNYFNPIDPKRRNEIPLIYNARWIHEVYLPRLTHLAKCLKEGRWPECA